MAHEIEIRPDGSGVALYAAVPAWHRLGELRPGLMRFEEVAAELPELVSEVRLAEMFVEIPRPDETGRTELRTVPTGRYASYRALDGKLLGVGLSDQYRLLQTRQAAEMADAVVEAADGAVYEAAFTLYEGRVTVMLLRLPEDVLVGGDERERHRQYLGVLNSFDGSQAFRLKPTNVRWVCANTVRTGLDEPGVSFRIRHEGAGFEGRIAEARRALGVLYLEQRRFSQKAERMVERPLSDGELEADLASLVPAPEAGGVQARAAALNARSVIRDLYLHDPTLSHLRGTGWGFFQAVCAYLDHRVPVRGDAPDARFRRVVLEERGGLAQRAARLALGA